MRVSINEAKNLCRKYGPCYPSRFGLTPKGLLECERIRSRSRRGKKPLKSIEIRMMVYEDGFHKSPSRQRAPYQAAAERLRQWQASRRVKPLEVAA
jgi:hypothetical protein